ncbi:hypothetical protein [Sphingomonas morindae]|uniref:(2Fe-2S) ferredoxin domain-containing protein n=1 Tax=Sphingomonas morindae TaxID=1541170 RepID=A0ABY4X8C8_9SPHN|nr:hypothetical protein [Sphingomonas morindae]USI73095.1 hypothetical protein LHA26_01030 [Sphingomonas morindae]
MSGRIKRDTVPAHWDAAVLVCGKCSRKLGGGFGPKGKTSLAKLLRKRARGKGRKADYGVIETPCLKLCPKGAVVAIDGRAPDRWQLIRPGEEEGRIAERLGLQSPSLSGNGSLPEMRRASAAADS